MTTFALNNPVKTIRLYGLLGKRYGRVFHIAVKSPAEAIRALCAMVPGFECELMNSQSKGVGYSVFVNKHNVQANFDTLPEVLKKPINTHDEIRIAPMLVGSKRGGLLQIFAGVALVVGSALSAGGLAAAFAAGGITGSIASMGAAIALGGLAQMISPQQKGLATADGPDNKASYNFNGPANTTAQGNCVPVLYGEMIVGSATISAGVFAEDQQ